MRRAIAWLAVVAVAAAAGWWGRGLLGGVPSAEMAPPRAAADGPCPGGAEALYWKAPMDPTYVRDEPGKSPMGMDLVPVCPDDEGATGEPGIRIDPAVVQSIGVRTAPVERRDLSRRVRTVGRVAYDERLVDHVHTKFQGWIEKLHVEYEGEAVERGQPLLEIYSPALVSSQEELLQAARYREATAASPFADVAEGGEALFRAARRRLELFDVPDRDIRRLLETGQVRKTLTLYAQTEGVVTHLMAREGMEVGPNDNLYTIADLSRVWVYGDVYEYELPWVEPGQEAHVELSYLPGRDFTGEVTYVYPFLDPKTRTARVRIELENPDRVLKPDMYANVTIDAQVLRDVVVVPEEAVLRSGRRTLVIVALGDGRFDPREVELGMESGEGAVQVRNGLAVGERIVTSGQFLIDSESRLREAVQQLLAGAEGEGAGADADAPDDEGHEGHVMPEPEEARPAPAATPGHEEHGAAGAGAGAEPSGAPDHEGHEGHDTTGMER